ncbi:MAG: triple tyrosine motif-containing protein [Flavobacteriaceae bacterium]|jgi:ligand-binding sensor domain-containing protein/DNA-binding CsgD family transcriptional regulator|tara:strand:- start:4748 stop:7417 length:2670 start_codon:yes stop_codon:yes gene_type:complete
MISESIDNEILFANSETLLLFNGTSWNNYPSPNGSVIRSVKYVDNKTYIGTHSDFGYYEKYNDGTLKYTSLVDELDLNIEEDEEFWNIMTLDNWIIFQSISRLIFIDKNNSDVKYLKFKGIINHSFSINRQIYVALDTGLYKLVNGQPELIIGSNQIPSTLIVNLFNSSKGLLILTADNGFYLLNSSGDVSKVPSSLDVIQNNLSIFSAIQLSDLSFAIGTVGQGLFLLDSDLKTYKIINKSKGLANNTILSLYEDSNSNIWLGLDNGITVINNNSPFSVYNDNNGVLGTVYATKLYNDILYIGTNQGLFYKKYNSNDSFKFIENTNGQVWSLIEIDGTLFCGHNNGTYIVKDANVIKIRDTSGSWTFRKLSNDSSDILEGSYYGLKVLSKQNNSWVVKNNVSGFDISSRFFEISNNGKIIVSHGYNGVYKLSVSSDFKNIIDYELDSIAVKGGNTSLSKFDNNIYYNYEKGMLKYNSLTNNFSKDTLLSNLSSKNLLYGIIRNDFDGKLWLFSENNIHYVYRDLVTGKKKVSSIVSSLEQRRTVFENISKIDKSKYLLGTNNGYISLDLDNYKLSPPEININKIEAFKLSQDPVAVSKNEFVQLEYNSNNLRFYANVSNYQKFQPITFEYFLDGYISKWVSISEVPFIEFNNLKPGDYEFKIRAKIGNLYSSNSDSFLFTVERPWYFSNFMIANYFLVFLIIFFLFNKSYEKYYRDKEQKIIRINQNKLELVEVERKQALMAVENNKLQNDIESKNRELAISTMSMIKKNQFLSKIKSDLKKSESGDKIFSVIKMIDRNLNNKDDWKFFEEAFNNADKDFLKKVKSSHPSLTNNDLRLCAYLRLNLSSKDIAPLLNISLSSVEIKRYRLRKKMQLTHNEGLTDHLLSL